MTTNESHVNTETRCRRCGMSAGAPGPALTERILMRDELGPVELLVHFCAPCAAGFDGDEARRSYVRGLLQC